MKRLFYDSISHLETKGAHRGARVELARASPLYQVSKLVTGPVLVNAASAAV